MKKLILPFILIVVAVGCDVVSSDKDIQSPITTRDLQLVVKNGKSTVIDLQKIAPGFKSATVTDGQGVKYFSNQYVKYTKSAASVDNFSITVLNADNTSTRINVLPSGDTAQVCTNNVPFTYAKISNTETLVVNLLNNPEFCGFNPFSGGNEIGTANPRAGIDTDENSEGVNVAICACGDEGDTGILTYTPPAGFVGQVKCKYYVQINGIPGDGSSGFLHGDSTFYFPQFSQYFSAHVFTIDVTN